MVIKWRSKGDAAWRKLATATHNRAIQIHCELDRLSDKLHRTTREPSKDFLLCP